METENEPLDWGNEEEEQQEALRRASHDYATRQDHRVAEEVEDDTISLGDEEEQGYYYQRDVAQKELYSADTAAKDPLERPPSAQRRAGSTGANDQQRSQHDYRDRDHFEGAPQPSNLSADSPSRHRNSRNQAPPVQPNATRLKHALPPKPQPAKVPYLPPSHPSIVAATSMTEISPRATSNDAKKTNGASGKLDLPPAASDLPPNWERRYARVGGQPYFYNKETYVSTWTHPVSSISSSSSAQSRHRTRSGSSSQTHMTTSNSDMHHTQASRANRDRSHGRPDPEVEDAPRTAVADPRDLSYEDRHYRPGGEPAPVGHEIHPVVRSEAVGSQIPRSRYDKSPAVSPTRQRRPRSLTPPSIREDHARTQDFAPPRRSDHMTRERHGYTNAETTLPRDVDMLPPDRWSAPHDPCIDFDRSERVSRKPPPRELDDRDLDHPSYKPSGRPPLNRRPDSNRVVPRDREPPRQLDTREHPTGNSSFLSASRPYPRERDASRDYPPYREPISDTGPPPPSDRKERMPRFERSASLNGPPSNIGPPDREPFNSRGRDYDNRLPPQVDNRPPPNYEQRRGADRNFDRGRRELTPEPMPPARHHVDNHHPRPGLERPARYPDPYDRPSPEEAQISQRRRAPLPPQETTFLSSGPSSGPLARDPPPHVPIQEFVPKSQGWANGDPNLPRRPKFDANNSRPLLNERERGRPSTPPGYGQDYRNKGPGPRPQDRGRHEYSQHPPKLDTRMDIDPRDLASTRRPPSPQNVRNPRVRVDDLDDLPEGPRSARSTHNAPERQSYHSTGPSIVPPPNARYENAPQGGFPPPSHRSGYPDDRRFNDQRDGRDGRDNRSGWRDNQSGRDNQHGNGYQDRIPPPPRRDFRGRTDDGGRPPAASGANNMPIGTRKHNLPAIPVGPPTLLHNGGPIPPPPAPFRFNPDARPPSSTLIHPGKALELNTRVSNRLAVDHHLPEVPQPTEPPSHSNQQSSALAEAEKSKRRVSRFSPLIPKSDVQHERAPAQPSSPVTAPEESNYHHATPPPISRNSSMLSVNEQISAQHSDRHSSDGRRTPHSDTQALGDRREDNALSSRFSDDVPASASSDFRARRMSATRSTLSPTDSILLQRWADQRGVATSPTMGDSERAVDMPPSLSRRMSGEKPPRHRKYSSQYKAPEDNAQAEAIVFEAREEYIQVVQESTLKDRLDNANSQRRGSLLDRLSSADNSVAPTTDLPDVQPQSLRDRLVPSKRDHNDMIDVNEPGSASYDGDDGGDNKRIKRRSAKGKRGGRR